MDLTSIFGSEIVVSPQPRDIDREYTGFPGGHGVTAMHLGSRGYRFIITGRLRATGISYNAARITLGTAIRTIEQILFADAAIYTFRGETYYYIVFDKFELIPGRDGKVFHRTSSCVTADFICQGRSLL